MATKITPDMIRAMGRGDSLVAVEVAREILATVGITDVELHEYEIAEIRTLRKRASNNSYQADQIEGRGPWPEGVPRE